MTVSDGLKKIKKLNLTIGRLAERNYQSYGKNDEDEEIAKLSHCLSGAFNWEQTEQGFKFWLEVFEALQTPERKEELTKIETQQGL